jgi:hypothetical protein
MKTPNPLYDFDAEKILEFTLGGVPFYLIEYYHREEGLSASLSETFLTLPSELVCGLANQSFIHPKQKQAVLDALSPFQVFSKVWATQILGSIVGKVAQQERQFIFPGAWFGQQSSLMHRNTRFRMRDTILVDMDPEACQVAESLLDSDTYSRNGNVSIINSDFFKINEGKETDQEIWHNRDPQAIYVWNGLEHFDPQTVKCFIADHPFSTFCLQSTSMMAEDHIHTCNDILDLLDYIPESKASSVEYAAEVSVPFGSRYMVIFSGSTY